MLEYFVASNDTIIANQVSTILVQLRQECPASHILRLDVAVATLEGIASVASKPPAAKESKYIVLIALAPDPDAALTVVRELRRRAFVRILAVGPTTDTKLVLRAMREGASEYLDQSELQVELPEALQRLEAGTSGRIIGVLAPGGGGGASTIAANVATVLAQKYHRCALIDLKLEAGDLAPLLDLKPKHTLTDVCQNLDRLDYSLLQSCLSQCDSGVQLLAAPARIADVPGVTPEAIDLILSLICRHFPIVILDLDHTFRAEQRQALLRVDLILLVLRLDFISLRNTRITLSFLQEIGVPVQKVRIVANRVGEPNQLTVAQVEESLGAKIVKVIPDDQKTVNRANNNGIPVVLQAPTAKVSRSLMDLASSLAGSANET